MTSFWFNRSGSTDSIFGPVRNPWNYTFCHSQHTGGSEEQGGSADWHIAGGSSGGSAVAVATGTCFGYHIRDNYCSYICIY